ncbi:flagellar filament capping protein FliD [Paenibacillus sp. CAU 1782]
MRMTGLASGMDIDSIVKQMMEARRAPLVKLQQKSLGIEYRQEAYRSVSTALVDLRNNKLQDNLSRSSAINAKKATVTGNTSAISVTTSSTGAPAGVYNVKVKELGTASSIHLKLDGNGPTDSTTLADLGFTGTSIKLVDNTDASNPKSVEISYNSSDTLNTLLTKINNNKAANVTALYSEATGEIVLTSKSNGERKISLEGGNISDSSVTPPPANSIIATATTGSDSKVEINGLTMTATNNRITVNEVIIQLNHETPLNEVSTITVATDSVKILDNIKTFISEYNKVLDTLNGKLGEDKYRSYAPLTDEQREELTDKQAELWDSKAKSGLLKNDGILSQTVSKLREALISDFGPTKGFNIQSIGITTGQWHEKGKLVIADESKLLAAIESDPDQIMQLFTAKSPDKPAEGYTKVNNKDSGVFTRVSDILMESIKLLSDKAGTSQVSTALTGNFLENSLLGTEKRQINDRITNLNRQLLSMETQYYKKFTAMESAINKFNSQSSSLSSFLG